MSDMDLVQGHYMVEEISDIMPVHLNVCLKARDCHLERHQITITERSYCVGNMLDVHRLCAMKFHI